jgi:hypothetical protein
MLTAADDLSNIRFCEGISNGEPGQVVPLHFETKALYSAAVGPRHFETRDSSEGICPVSHFSERHADVNCRRRNCCFFALETVCLWGAWLIPECIEAGPSGNLKRNIAAAIRLGFLFLPGSLASVFQSGFKSLLANLRSIAEIYSSILVRF